MFVLEFTDHNVNCNFNWNFEVVAPALNRGHLAVGHVVGHAITGGMSGGGGQPAEQYQQQPQQQQYYQQQPQQQEPQGQS